MLSARKPPTCKKKNEERLEMDSFGEDHGTFVTRYVEL